MADLTDAQSEKLLSLCNGNETQLLYALLEQAMLTLNKIEGGGDLTDIQKSKLQSLCNVTGIQGERDLMFALLEQLMLQQNALA